MPLQTHSRASITKFSVIALLLIAVVFGSIVSPHRSESVEAQAAGICGRSSTVQRAILRQLDNLSCDEVTSADLASIESLWIGFSFSGFTTGDLDGLTSLKSLGIFGRNITPFPATDFQDLSSLESLWVYDGAATKIVVDSFSGLAGLQVLTFYGPRVITIDPGAFNGLTSLDSLRIVGRSIATIATNAFDDPTNSD